MDDFEDKFNLKQATGRFVRPKRHQIPEDDPDKLDHPTQKIILFPTEKSQALPDNPSPPSTPKPPIMFTQPLPKVEDLPKDFLELGELDELEGNPLSPPDFSKHLTGDIDPIQTEHGFDISSEKQKIAQFIKDLEEKADHYADNMFLDSENENLEEIERIERLIPGTDHEEGRRVLPPSRQKVKKKVEKNLPPDIDPKKLGLRFHKPLASLKLRRSVLFFLTLFSILISFQHEAIGEVIPWFLTMQNQVLALGVLLLLAMGLTSDLLWQGFLRGIQLQVGSDTVSLFAGIFCGLDCLLQGLTKTPRGHVPYVSLLLIYYWFLLYGDEQKRKAGYRSCRFASMQLQPFLLTLEPRKWNAKPAYTKSHADAKGFTCQLQQNDGVQNVFAYTSPLFLLCGFLLALYLTHSTEDFVWAYSALLLVANPFGSAFLYGRASNKVSLRLGDLGSALAGWPAIEKVGKQCIISDSDLFPAGNVEVSGTFLLPKFNERKVLAYTSAMLLEGEFGCSRLFQNILVERDLKPPKVLEVAYHDGGGMTGRIGMDAVMVGNADFMELMNVRIPEGTYVSNTIFCCINDKLGGVFTLEYKLSPLVSQSLKNLLRERIQPVLATRDFALTPDMLRHRFKINTDKMAYPSVTRRRELSSDHRPKDGLLTALILREGLEALSDCVIAARRLRKTVYVGIFLCLCASLFGFLLVAYLIANQSYNSLAPINLLIFMILWLPPFWLLTDLPQRY